MVKTETIISRWRDFFSNNKVSWPTYVLICLFGLGSWVAVNGLWVELPVLVKDSPEGWNLPSYLAVIVQLANVGPLIYAIGNHFAPKKVHEKTAIPFIVSIGAVACALLGFYWNKTSYIGGHKHSTALFILSFFLAIVDCTSSVVFLTFMSLFPSFYLSALFVGETSSGLLPAFVALGQGIGSGSGSYNTTNATNSSSHQHTAKDDGLKFGPEGFFFFLFSIMVVCGLAFLALIYLPVAKRQHVMKITLKNAHTKESDDETQPLCQDFPKPARSGHDPTTTQDSNVNPKHSGYQAVRDEIDLKIIFLLCIQAWINCLSNGVLSSIQAYASEPYGEKTYHLGKFQVLILSSGFRCFSRNIFTLLKCCIYLV